MILRTITPPPGSAIAVVTDGLTPVITIPQPSGGFGRIFVGLFMLFWLGGWFMGFRSAVSEIIAGKAQLFHVFWLAGWTVGGGFAVWTIFRVLRPSVAETLKLEADGIVYDSGVPPFRQDFSMTNRRDAWKSYFPKRTVVAISKRDLSSLRLREADSDNRLTVDLANTRVDLARAASEVEREWLYRVLTERYALPAASSAIA